MTPKLITEIKAEVRDTYNQDGAFAVIFNLMVRAFGYILLTLAFWWNKWTDKGEGEE